MRTVALHARIKPGRELDYERAHRAVPAEVLTALRSAGVHDYAIWRDGPDLFHAVHVEDYGAMRSALSTDPAIAAWRAEMAELLETTDDYTGDNAGLPLVWQMP
jgi:L-rhamnose mutarotase